MAFLFTTNTNVHSEELVLLKVYYDEVDGHHYPKLIIVPADSSQEHVSYNVQSPFERMFPEDFHDDFKAITISQGELLRNNFENKRFIIDINLVKQSLIKREIYPDMIYEIDYFTILIDDLEELLQMDIKRFYLE